MNQDDRTAFALLSVRDFVAIDVNNVIAGLFHDE
jgi:hypothetical protein